MLHNSKDMPKVQIISDPKSIEKYGGSRMYFAPPIDYDTVMRRIPRGKLTTVEKIRNTSPRRTARTLPGPSRRARLLPAPRGPASITSQETPWWRTLKANGKLNPKYPDGAAAQRGKLEAEGHSIVCHGRTHKRYFAKDYEAALFSLEQETEI